MKTVKLNEKTVFTLKNLQANIGLNANIKLKTYDEAIIFLYQAFLSLTPGSQQEKEFIEKSRTYFNDKSKK